MVYETKTASGCSFIVSAVFKVGHCTAYLPRGTHHIKPISIEGQAVGDVITRARGGGGGAMV